ncbi:MAG: PA domain-containing protein, partial [Natronosporangium sp.]
MTVTGVDRDGRPAQGPVHLWSAETGELHGGFMGDGTATIQVPDGLYSMSATLDTREGIFDPPTSTTVAGDPDLTIRRDRTLHLDARDGEPVQVSTDRDAVVDSYNLTWRRQVGDRSFSLMAAQTGAAHGTELYTIPSRPARTGSYDVATTWSIGEPLLSIDLPGPDDPTPWYASFADPFVGQGPVPVVDAGTGTPEEFAGLDAEGKLVLVTRRGEFTFGEQVAAAEAAGAALVLGLNDRPGLWREFLFGAGVPPYLVDQATGEAIRAALAGQPEPVLDLTAIASASYSYQLAFQEDRVPGGRTYQTDEHPMATVQSDYRAASERMNRNESWVPYVDGMVLGTSLPLPRSGPVVRTEQISTSGVQWQRFAQPHQEFPSLYWTSSGVVQYQPDQQYQQLWWGPLTRPGVPPTTGFELVGLPVARFRDAIRIVIDHYLYDNGQASGTIFEQAGDHSELTLRRNGEVVGESSWPQVQFTVPPEDAELELELAVTSGPGNFSDLSTHTESTWRFRSARPEADREVLPLVQLGYHLEAGPRNEVPAGAAYPLLLDPGYQPGATGPGGFTVEVEVSYDDGASWTVAPVTPVDGMVQA